MTEEEDEARETAIALAGELVSNPRGWGLTPQQLEDVARWLLDMAWSGEKREQREIPIEALTVLVAKIRGR